MIDLDDIEAKASAAKRGPPRLLIDDLDKAFIAAVSPNIVIRLIAVARAAKNWLSAGGNSYHESDCACTECKLAAAVEALETT